MKTANYKGKTYRVKFIGDTKYGKRANLEFMDGSKNFWVDASLVTVGGEPAKKSPVTFYMPRAGKRNSRSCPVCGGNEFNQVDCGECA